MQSESAKLLLMKDTDYATPSDHYFSYLAKNKMQGDLNDLEKDKEVLNKLSLDKVLPPKTTIPAF